MKSGWSVLQVNVHRLTKSDFRLNVTLLRWRLQWHFTQKSAATWWMKTKHLPGNYVEAASIPPVPDLYYIGNCCLCCHHINFVRRSLVTDSKVDTKNEKLAYKAEELDQHNVSLGLGQFLRLPKTFLFRQAVTHCDFLLNYAMHKYTYLPT